MTDWIADILASPQFTALVLTAFASGVTGIVAWAARLIRRYVLRHLDERELALLRQIAVISVDYVEQVYQGADGPTKLAEATRVANAMIASYGLKVSAEQLLAIIEAAVYAEIARAELPTPPLGD